MLYVQPENQSQEDELEKWQKNVLENYDELSDLHFWIQEKGEDGDPFEN